MTENLSRIWWAQHPGADSSYSVFLHKQKEEKQTNFEDIGKLQFPDGNRTNQMKK